MRNDVEVRLFFVTVWIFSRYYAVCVIIMGMKVSISFRNWVKSAQEIVSHLCVRVSAGCWVKRFIPLIKCIQY